MIDKELCKTTIQFCNSLETPVNCFSNSLNNKPTSLGKFGGFFTWKIYILQSWYESHITWHIVFSLCSFSHSPLITNAIEYTECGNQLNFFAHFIEIFTFTLLHECVLLMVVKTEKKLPLVRCECRFVFNKCHRNPIRFIIQFIIEPIEHHIPFWYDFVCVYGWIHTVTFLRHVWNFEESKKIKKHGKKNSLQFL